MKSAFLFSTLLPLLISVLSSCSAQLFSSLISNRKNPCIMGKQYMEATVVDVRLKKVSRRICAGLLSLKGKAFREGRTATIRSCIEWPSGVPSGSAEEKASKLRGLHPCSHWAELPVQCFLLLIPPGIRALESGALQRRLSPREGRNDQSWSYLRITDIVPLVNVWYPYPLFLNLCVQGA